MNITSPAEIPSNESYNASTNGLDCGGDPHQYAIWEKAMIVMIAVFLSFTTVVGNIMVMVSFKIDKQLQTISNYFLFSLAMADFIIGSISMPLFTIYTVLGYWPFGPYVCDTWLALDYLASNASVLNLLIISFDRYFSVTRPLTYRVRRTTFKAFVMIGCAWGISLLLWPPWIYAWPYFEGQRTVPANACYIQFIETNHYITFGTAIAAFYVPVSVMMILYWRIWKETKKRQKDLPNLQAGKQDASKRSNSSEETLNMGNCRRARSESSIGDELHSTQINASYIEKRYPGYESKYRPFSWNWLKMWCVAWWHSGRDDEEEDEDAGGAESSRTVYGYDDIGTPLSVETPLPSTVSQCGSLGTMHAASGSVDKSTSTTDHHSNRRPGPSGDHLAKSISNDSVHFILIQLPSKECGNVTGNYGNELPSIKMYPDDVGSFHHQYLLQQSIIQEEEESSGGSGSKIYRRGVTGVVPSPSSIIRRPSHMPDIRIPLDAKNVPKAGGKGLLNKAPNKKKKKIQEKKADRKAAKTLSAILLAFMITWTPYNILVLLKSLTACSWYIPQKLWDFFYYLCYINSTVNPMCYALCNAAFRRTYVRILKCKWHTRNRTAIDRGY